MKIDTKIKNTNELSKFKVEYYKDKNILYEKVAKLIFENKIIGFFNDQMEFGARALGNRSILANPCDTKIQDIINIVGRMKFIENKIPIKVATPFPPLNLSHTGYKCPKKTIKADKYK